MVRQMSDREILRGQLMGQLVEGKLDQRAAAERLGVSVRQVKRLKRAYLADGIAGVISKRRGVPSNRGIKPDVLAQALALIRAHYAGFGPTLACEKLRERHGVVLSVETVRKQMVLHGLWAVHRAARVQVHQMRERRSRSGELIQVDGSPHDWFEGRSARSNSLTSKPRLITWRRCNVISHCTACRPCSTATATASSASAANAWLPGYIQAFNRRFAVGAACAQDAHVPYLGKTDALRRILSIQEDRVLSKNLSCQYEGALLQVKIAGTGIGMRGATVRGIDLPTSTSAGYAEGGEPFGAEPQLRR